MSYNKLATFVLLESAIGFLYKINKNLDDLNDNLKNININLTNININPTNINNSNKKISGILYSMHGYFLRYGLGVRLIKPGDISKEKN
jgi:hypothetical protein